MNGKQDTITTTQAAVLVISIILADITMERSVSEETKTPDVWLSVLVGGIFSLLIGYICVKLSQRYPGKTYFVYNREIVGRPIGFLFSVAFIGYNLMLAAYAVRMHAEFSRYFLLDRTPIEVMIVIFLAVGTYIAMGGINPVTKVAEFFTPFTVLSFVVIWILSIKIVHTERLLPVLAEGVAPIFKGAVPTVLGYIGFESMLVYTAFMRMPKHAVKAVVIGVVVPIVFYIMNAVTTIGYLGVEEATTLTWPSMELVKGISFPGGFFENFEVLMIGVWIILMFMSYLSAHYIASLGLNQLFNVNIKILHFVVAVAIYFLAMLPKDINGAFQFGTKTGYAELLSSALCPLLLLVISVIKGRRHEK